MTDILHEYQCTCMTIFRFILLRMRNYLDKSCRENPNAHVMFDNLLFVNCAFCEITWKSIVKPDRQQMTLWRMRFACWITKASNKHSEYVILIAFPQQKWFRNVPQRYVYTYIVCPVYTLRLSDIKTISHRRHVFNYWSTNKILRTMCKYITHRNTKLHTHNSSCTSVIDIKPKPKKILTQKLPCCFTYFATVT